MYRTALLSSDYEVDEAEDGRDALAKVFARRPALIVTETRLRFISGQDLCALLRGDDETSNIPIIVLTGDDDPEQSERALAAGADVVLVKPCLPEALVEAVCRLDGQPPAGLTSSEAATSSIVRGSSARRPVARSYRRFETIHPPRMPPVLECLSCDEPLHYERSHVGGVSDRHPEQWDYFVCRSCGTFEYRQRTRTLRRVVKR